MNNLCKKFVVLIFFVIASGKLFSQLKVGDNVTTINTNSILELETTNKGFVLPRLSLTSINSSSPLTATLLTGTIVYNTNSAITGGSGVGLYYWDGSKWNFLANASNLGSYWSLTGNSGTTPSTSGIGTAANNNFIGTTDAKDWVMTTNGYERMRIASAGNIGIQKTPAATTLLDITTSATTNAFNVTGGNIVNITGNALTGGTALNVSSSSAAGTASGFSYLLKLTRTGANTNSAHTAYGIYSSVANTNATSGTNIAGYFSASSTSAAVTNYGVIVPSNASGNAPLSGFNTATPVSNLDVNGSFGNAINSTAITGATTLDATYGTVIATPGASTYNITLPAANTTARRIYRVIYNGTIGSSKIGIVPTGADLLYLDGKSYSTYNLANGSITVQSDGISKWYVVEDNSGGSGGNVGTMYVGYYITPSPTVQEATINLGTNYTLTSNSRIFVQLDISSGGAGTYVYISAIDLVGNSFNIFSGNGKFTAGGKLQYLIIN